MKKFIAERVSQIEANRLDGESKNMLTSTLTSCFELFDSAKVNRFAPEISLVVDYILFRNTIAQNEATPGSAIYNLKYAQIDATGVQRLSGRKIVLFFALDVLLRNTRWKRKVFAIAELAQKAYNFLDFLAFVAFLFTGKHMSLLLRVIGVTLAPENAQRARRHIDFSLMYRMLFWNTLQDVLALVLPLTQQVFRSRFAQKLLSSNALKNFFFSTTFLGSVSSASQAAASGNSLQKATCGICRSESITMRRDAPCACAFCYYCINNYVVERDYSGGKGWDGLCPSCNKYIGREALGM